MKAILVSVVLSFCITSGVIFYVNGGRVKMNNLVLKNGVLTVRPTGVVIKPQ